MGPSLLSRWRALQVGNNRQSQNLNPNSKMRRYDQIGSKYSLPSSMKVGSHFAIKIYCLHNDAYAKIAENWNDRFSTFLNFFLFFRWVKIAQISPEFFGVLFYIEWKQVGVRIFRERALCIWFFLLQKSIRALTNQEFRTSILSYVMMV